jgi:hypothetical protein
MAANHCPDQGEGPTAPDDPISEVQWAFEIRERGWRGGGREDDRECVAAV